MTIQAQILDLLLTLQRERGMALVLITHDMGVVAETAQRVMVMYAGQVMEERAAADLFAAPQHPYTAALLAALPERSDGGAARDHSGRRAGPVRPAARLPVQPALRLRDRAFARRAPGAARLGGRPDPLPLPARRSATRERAIAADHARRRGDRVVSAPVVEASNLKRVYEVRRGLFREPARLQAVGGVSFTLEPGRTLAVVGESGCGKSTLARMVDADREADGGHADARRHRRGEPARRRAPSDLRRTVQLVFQNPYGSLNPRKKVGAILEEPLVINTDLPQGRAHRARARDDGEGRACGPSTTAAIRTCSPAASASASPSRAP